MFENNTIIITNDKKHILKNNNSLLNIKIYSIEEFKRLFYFDYNKETIYYITEKYSVIPEIAQIYISNMYNIEEKSYINKKLDFLSNLKKELLNNNLIKINKLFKSNLKHKKIVIYNINKTKELDNLMNELSKITEIEYINEASNNYIHTIYELDIIEDEIIYVANEICRLVNEGKDITKIYLANLDNEYRKIIKRIFPMFNIPVTLEENNSLYGTFICTKFIEFYESDLNNTISKLKEISFTPESDELINSIISIINQYSFVEDKLLVKELIINDLKNTKVSQKNNTQSIHETSIHKKIINDDEIVFLMSFNQGIIPSIYKDEDYLTDNDKKELNISLTIDKNNNNKELIINNIRNIKNLIITSKKSANGTQYNISNINEILEYEVKHPVINYIYSNLYNKLKLTSLLDEYYKYNTTSSLLYLLNNTYQDIPYNTYDNTYKQISPVLIKDYLKNSLNISYSSLNTYFKCPFSFYLNNVLNINLYEDTFQTILGKIFHTILEKRNTNDIEQLWDEELKKANYEFKPQDLFMLSKLKEELKIIIQEIDKQENFTNLHEELHEQRISTKIDLNSEYNITFSGIVDKIKYHDYSDKTIVSIIDYKTGDPEISLSTLPYGIDIQLPIYLYLINNYKRFNNPQIAGFYLQKILTKEVTSDDKHSYDELKSKSLMLQGYSNYDTSILGEFDTTFINSQYIKSMKMTKEHNFYNYSKVLTTKQMNMISKMVEDKIYEGAQKIIDSDFSISPKYIPKKINACEYCKFSDICYHTNKDTIELKKISEEDFLGGEENGIH